MWLLLLLTTLFAAGSQAMMSYLAMHVSLGPWVGPVFVIVCMALMIPLISRKWFGEHAIVTIAAGSIGGMVGLCLGMTIPSFYFLHKAEFLMWLDRPAWFAGIISLLVLSAGSVAFLIVYLIKDHLIVQEFLPFPLSKLAYNIVAIEKYSSVHRFMWIGVGMSCVWNAVVFVARIVLQSIVMQMQMVPLLVSVGFIVGHLITIPAVIGLINRRCALDVLRTYFFSNVLVKEFLIMFCLGMLAVQVFQAAVLFVQWFMRRHQDFKTAHVLMHIKNRFFKKNIALLFLLSIIMSSVVLCSLGIKTYELCFVFPVLFIVGLNVSRIVGEIGIVDLGGFVWCVLLPLLYGSMVSSLNLLIVALYVTLCLGIVIDLIFSYKLTHLAKIAYKRVLTYQMYGFFIATITSGVVMWLYAQTFDEQSLYLLAPDAQDLDALIKFGAFNYKIFICGMVSGVAIILAGLPLLGIVAMTLMSPSVSVWLIVAGACSYFVPDREKYYPLCFGVYAAHAIWMIVWAVL